MSIILLRVITLLMLLVLVTGCQSNTETPGSQPVGTAEVQIQSPTQTAADAEVPVTAATAAASATAVVERPGASNAPASTAAVGASLTPTAAGAPAATSESTLEIVEFPVPTGSHPHDVAPAPDGSVWYTAQATGELGKLNPATGETHHIPLGSGSAPHGVIVGPDNAAWVTDSGLNAIVRVDPETEAVQVFKLPENAPNANLNTAAFDGAGVLWFTGQNGYYGRLDPSTGEIEVFDAPRGRGPYGIAATPDGAIYYVSLAGSHLASVDLASGKVTEIDPPTPEQGARRVWSDSTGRLWVSEWRAGQLARFDPQTGEWREWRLPGDQPQPYAVYVDDQDQVWLSDFSANAMVRFDPVQETFTVLPIPSRSSNVRQILGRPGEVWGAESGVDKLILIRTK